MVNCEAFSGNLRTVYCREAHSKLKISTWFLQITTEFVQISTWFLQITSWFWDFGAFRADIWRLFATFWKATWWEIREFWIGDMPNGKKYENGPLRGKYEDFVLRWEIREFWIGDMPNGKLSSARSATLGQSREIREWAATWEIREAVHSIVTQVKNIIEWRPAALFLTAWQSYEIFLRFPRKMTRNCPKCFFLLTLLNGCFYFINIDNCILTDIPAEWPILLYSEPPGGHCVKLILTLTLTF